LRQPKESGEEKKSALALPSSPRADIAGADKPQSAAQARREMLPFLGETPHRSNMEGGWRARCGCTKEYSSIGKRRILPIKGSAGIIGSKTQVGSQYVSFFRSC